ncbi:hypothetical protein J4436_02675 [Candidatus Woesearchaeota archaeon]|nr:hypothetical protein [Candidatus Woesearchaeota archaeon]
MHFKWKKIGVLYSLISLFLLNNVYALGLPNLVNIYYKFSGWFDFIIFFIFFTSISKVALSKVYGENEENEAAFKGLYVSLGLILSFALVGWEYYSGVNLLSFGPIVLIAFGLGLVIFLISKIKGGEKGGWFLPILLTLVGLLVLWLFFPEYLTYIPYGDDLIWIIFFFLILYLIIKSLKMFKGKLSVWGNKPKKEKEQSTNYNLRDYLKGNKPEKKQITGSEYERLDVYLKFLPDKKEYFNNEDFSIEAVVLGGSGNYNYFWDIDGTKRKSNNRFIDLNGKDFIFGKNKKEDKFKATVAVLDNITGKRIVESEKFSIVRVEETQESVTIIVKDLVENKVLNNGDEFVQLKEPTMGEDLEITALFLNKNNINFRWEIPGIILGVREKQLSFRFNSGEWGFGKTLLRRKEKNKEKKEIILNVNSGGVKTIKRFNLVLIKKESSNYMDVEIITPLAKENIAMESNVKFSAYVVRDVYSQIQGFLWFYRNGWYDYFEKNKCKPLITKINDNFPPIGSDISGEPIDVIPIIPEPDFYTLYAVAISDETTLNTIDKVYDYRYVIFYKGFLKIINPQGNKEYYNHNRLLLEAKLKESKNRIVGVLWRLEALDNKGNNLKADGKNIVHYIETNLIKQNDLESISQTTLDINLLSGIFRIVAIGLDKNKNASKYYIDSINIKIKKAIEPDVVFIYPKSVNHLVYNQGEEMRFKVEIKDLDNICHSKFVAWKLVDQDMHEIPIDIIGRELRYKLPMNMRIGMYKIYAQLVSIKCPKESKVRDYLLTYENHVDLEIKKNITGGVVIKSVKWPQ